MKLYIVPVIFHLLMTVILVNDFFPDKFPIGISGSLLAFALIGLTIINIVYFRGNSVNDSLYAVLSTLYLVGVIFILTLLGGQSSVGISLQNPFILLLIVSSIISAVRKYWKQKQN